MKEQLAGLMRQAQQMQENMSKLQEQLASIEDEGQSGAGMVRVTMTRRRDVKRVSIDSALLADDKEMLEDLVAAALNHAVAKGDASQLCVVETPGDLLMMEQTLAYHGLYFVLMGRLSPLDGIGPREIGLDLMQRRLADGEVKEVIVATNFTNEGEATAHYISEMLKGRDLRVTRIARCVPVGGELEDVYTGTLAQAFVERRLL